VILWEKKLPFIAPQEQLPYPTMDNGKTALRFIRNLLTVFMLFRRTKLLVNFRLGLTSSTTLDELKKTYRRLIMQHHPDKGGDAEFAKKIIAAYTVCLQRFQ